MMPKSPVAQLKVPFFPDKWTSGMDTYHMMAPRVPSHNKPTGEVSMTEDMAKLQTRSTKEPGTIQQTLEPWNTQ